jgi:hypothetical protein
MPTQELSFSLLDGTGTTTTVTCLTDHSISAMTTVRQDQGKPAEHQTILVTPGQWMRLRGADETWHAIQQDYYEQCHCLDCGQNLLCMSDACLVLCPQCYSISPLEDKGAAKSAHLEGGIGVGFTIVTLFEVQASAWRD